MPRAMWNGALSFGLVTVPVKLYPATSPKDIRFNQLHDDDHGRIQMKRVCSKDGQEVPYDKIVKGYEVAPEQYVIIRPEELEQLDPEASRSIDILDFVPLAQIDPVFFENAYFLVPDQVGTKAYALLLAAMKDSQRVAIASMVMRGKQYLCAIRPTQKALALSTLLFVDEVNKAEDIEGLPEGLPKVDPRELAMAKQLIDTLSADFEPGKYKDDYRERVLELIRQRAAGEVVTVKAPAAKPARSWTSPTPWRRR
jgi:DNA end-binding protein Ku